MNKIPSLVRPATVADAETIARYNAEMAQETERLTLDWATVLAGTRAALADPAKALYFVVEVDGAVVAQLMITHEWSDWRNGDIWWVQSVYVHPGHRGKGLFRALYEHVADLARERGAVGLRLYVERENHVAQKSYAKLGMELTHYLVMEEMFGRDGGAR